MADRIGLGQAARTMYGRIQKVSPRLAEREAIGTSSIGGQTPEEQGLVVVHVIVNLARVLEDVIVNRRTVGHLAAIVRRRRLALEKFPRDEYARP